MQNNKQQCNYILTYTTGLDKSHSNADVFTSADADVEYLVVTLRITKQAMLQPAHAG